MDIEIHRVQSVTAKRDEVRKESGCRDHDRYRMMIGSVDHTGHPLRVEVILYAEPGADIGLGPLVEVSADE